MALGPTLACPRLGSLDWEDLASVTRAFADAPPCELRQAWLPSPQPSLRPGFAKAGWRDDCLLVFADLEDDDVFSNATGLNQRTWELGDSFEMFLEAEAAADYSEFHVAPNNQKLQMRIPIPRPRRAPEDFMIEGAELFVSRVWVGGGRWRLLAVVPYRAVGARPARFSFSRYDYTRGRPEPVLSSTSPHAELDFHRRDEWGRLAFA